MSAPASQLGAKSKRKSGASTCTLVEEHEMPGQFQDAQLHQRDFLILPIIQAPYVHMLAPGALLTGQQPVQGAQVSFVRSAAIYTGIQTNTSRYRLALCGLLATR